MNRKELLSLIDEIKWDVENDIIDVTTINKILSLKKEVNLKMFEKEMKRKWKK